MAMALHESELQPTDQAVRLRRPPDFDGNEDGAWWPRSGDVTQIADFARALSAQVGPVHRITLNPALWTTHPRLLDLDGRKLRIDWFDSARPDVVSVRRGYQRRLQIVLVPPTETWS
jgi:hypothetical protein